MILHICGSTMQLFTLLCTFVTVLHCNVLYITVLCRRSLCSMVLRRLWLFVTVVESTVSVLLYDIAYLW